MLQSIITWTHYDGTAETRPHSIKKDYWDCGERSRTVIERHYLLLRKGETTIADQAFSLRPRRSFHLKCTPGVCGDEKSCDSCPYKATYFVEWFWQSAWLTSYEDNLEYPLQVGDLWATWPGIGEQVKDKS